MGWVVIRHARIGEEVRAPGYVLTDEDLIGRDVRAMEQVERVVRWDDNAQPSARRRGKKTAETDDASAGNDE